jgi:spore germination protein YaaH
MKIFPAFFCTLESTRDFMKSTLAALSIATALLIGVTAQAQKTIFWMGNGLASVHSFMEHKDKIDTIEPTWYNIDAGGLVVGEPNLPVLKAAKDAHVTIIPLFALFDYKKLHVLANDQKAQDTLIEGLIREAKEHGYDGVNLDIEDVMWTDRDQLSVMVAKIAAALHKEHLQVQIDVCPYGPGHPGETAFSQWIFEEWRLGYDLKSLAQSVDLICLMTYDQHTHWTTPGPVGGWLWTKMNLDFALKTVPKEKISLGIALYGYHWYTGDPGLNKEEKKPNVTADYISYPNLMLLADTYRAKQQWDDEEHTPWFYYTHDAMREYVFYTDKRAFMDRYDMAKSAGVEGVCAWVLGEEDPSIWGAIPAKR